MSQKTIRNFAMDISVLNDTINFTYTPPLEGAETCTYSFDMQDAEQAEQYYAAASEMQKAHLALPKDVDVLTDIRNFCTVVRNFFDAILGEGAGQALIPRDNRRLVIDVYNAFIQFVQDQNKALAKFADKTGAQLDAVNQAALKAPKVPTDHLPPKKRGTVQ